MPENTYTVWWIGQRDPERLHKLGEYRANNGHGAIVRAIEANDGLSKCDLVAVAKWAETRAHYPSAWETDRMSDLHDQAVQAAAKELGWRGKDTDDWDYRSAAHAVAAAEPFIRADARADVRRRIVEILRSEKWSYGSTEAIADFIEGQRL